MSFRFAPQYFVCIDELMTSIFLVLRLTVLKTLEDIGVDLILGERLDIESTKAENIKFNARGQRVVRTLAGREVAADLMVGSRQPICSYSILCGR